jgi:phosphoglycerate-specific signal transduction histidine kinase
MKHNIDTSEEAFELLKACTADYIDQEQPLTERLGKLKAAVQGLADSTRDALAAGTLGKKGLTKKQIEYVQLTVDMNDRQQDLIQETIDYLESLE